MFYRDLLIIVTNKAFVSLSLSAAVLGTIVSGFSTFGPKFVEEQFSRSASDAANIFGRNYSACCIFYSALSQSRLAFFNP